MTCSVSPLAIPRTVVLRAARLLCKNLRQSYSEDITAPLNAIESCEAQLALLEAWVLGQSMGSPLSNKKQVEDTLALPHGLASTASEAAFIEKFSPLLDKEILAHDLECSTKSSSTYLPGRLYVTTTRLCFQSDVKAFSACFSLPWEHVTRIRATIRNHSPELSEQSENDGAEEEHDIHQVRLVLSKPLAFDGAIVVESLELIMFDSTAVEILHRCTSVFRGHGVVQGVFEQIMMPPTAGTLKKDVSDVFLEESEKIKRYTETWQLQTRTTLFNSWQMYNPAWASTNDASGSYVPHPKLPENFQGSYDDEYDLDDSPPISSLYAFGRQRRCRWQAVVDADTTDEDGWEYSDVTFSIHADRWSKDLGMMSHVRRRRWRAEFPPDSEIAALSALVERPLTLIQMQKLKSQEIFDAVIGRLPLDMIGAWLLEDDWLAPGSFMEADLEDRGAENVELTPWAETQKVMGKLRTVNLVAPVPPAPMCPVQTRVSQTAHVVVDEERVILETSAMSMDVPCGKCFKVVICDTFTVDKDSGKTIMVRTFAVDWVESTWMKSLVEANLPGNLVKDAERSAALLRAWRKDRMQTNAGSMMIPMTSSLTLTSPRKLSETVRDPARKLTRRLRKRRSGGSSIAAGELCS